MSKSDLIRRYMAELGRKRWAGVKAEDRKAALARARAARDADPDKRKAVGKRLAEARKAARERRSKAD